MQVSEEALDRFIKVYEDEFKETIARPEARIMASELLDIMKVTCRPIPAEHDNAETMNSYIGGSK